MFLQDSYTTNSMGSDSKFSAVSGVPNQSVAYPNALMPDPQDSSQLPMVQRTAMQSSQDAPDAKKKASGVYIGLPYVQFLTGLSRF